MKFIHTAQRYRPQTALFESRRIIEAGRMDSKSELGAAGDCEMYAFKFSLLTVLLWVFAFLLVDFNRPRAECALMHDTCALKELRSDSA